MQSEGLSSSVWYEELSKWDFIHLVQSCGKGWLVRFRLARGTKQVGNRSSGTKSRMDSVSTSVWYDESSMQDFVRREQSHANGRLVLVRPIRGNNQAGICPSSTKTRERELILIRPEEGIK